MMSKRRLACPQTVQHIWDAIVCIRQQKQIPNVDRLANYMRRKHGLNQADLERQLSFALRDNLVRVTTKVGCKGSKQGVQQEGYRLPSGEVERDGYDWYCFECHRGGEVCLCTTCHRVYHSFCVKEDVASAENFQCAICKMCRSKNNFKMKKTDLNTLLTYTCNRLKEKVSSISPFVPEDKKQTRDLHRMPATDEEKWRHDLLLFYPMDLNSMEEKAQALEYRRLEEFQADAQSIVHNVVIYYGVHSPMADMARQMLRDCIYDLGEIRQCRDCYRMSNEKTDKFWFCQPCNPPHELVYAKQKGFPYWPAKVIRRVNGVYDVRFFGGYHQRANIEKEHIKPISTNIHSLSVKRTASWNRACEELRRHQELLEKQKRELKLSRTETTEKEVESGGESCMDDPEEPITPEDVKKIKIEKDSDEKKTEKEKEKEIESDLGPMYDESSISSSSKLVKQMQQAPTPEDYNVVSSSSQDANTRVSVATQTYRRLLPSRFPSKSIQTESEPLPPPPPVVNCKCNQKNARIKEKNDEEAKERTLKELSDKLHVEFEEQKQTAVAAALNTVQKEVEKARRHAEERLQKDHKAEMQLQVERHRQQLSETKKKQWCYNCEAEAIYHCCWNTSYCSIECQQVHWQKEHKRNCRRKR
uniref:Zinc finger MYND domain-containing protein 11 n=1 Tax=Strigamia maritima TaxID=126957 RepID=T1JNA1_STRMM